ncbi:1,3-beta-glucanosyltransferase [Roridomyces roridus]|uniref:1,3-beta-glucanosyltransferase n=1 Tax=Roridomyces roridus TaxID=1738132 RepID=A0AAD7BM18_9AGAR|nr:1,3-beta-glucanosyltransferase [Roridomyces roridus]
MFSLLRLAVPLLLLASAAVTALPKVSRTGKYLYTEDGDRFFIKGVAYQTQHPVVPGTSFVDNLADGPSCTRDVEFFQKLGINAIRSYFANSSLDHDSCMSTLSDAGIYVILDLTLPLNGSIDTTQPAWGTNVLDQYLRTIDTFEKYDNVLAYNIGNEVIKSDATQSAPFIMAAARDIRAYLNSISSSSLVAYAAIDGGADFVDNTADYLACDRSADSATASLDLYGLNNYEWCGNDTVTTFNNLNARFANYDIAAYFSEFGSENCNPNPRVWTEVPVMFDSNMTDVWSGGLAFSYFPDTSKGKNFGLMTPSSDSSSFVTTPEFDNLAAQYNAVTFVKTPTKTSVSNVQPSACPQATPSSWPVSNTLPPTADDAACGCLANALSCVFTPSTPDYTDIVGDLTGIACGLLIQNGGSCADISADGAAGVYGDIGMCDPTIKLSYVFTQYYEQSQRIPAACGFNGNATVNTNAGYNGVAAAVKSCIPSPSAVFTPRAPPVLVPVQPTGSSGAGKSAGGNSNTNTNSGRGARDLLVGASAVLGSMIVGMLWTLA